MKRRRLLVQGDERFRGGLAMALSPPTKSLATSGDTSTRMRLGSCAGLNQSPSGTEGRMASRRGHGEGSISKRKVDGKVVGYVAMLDMGYVDGKRKRKAIYGKTRGEVRDRLDEEKRRPKAGMVTTGKSQTVEAYLTTWLNVWAKPKARPATFTTYEM
jgi:hypothetical protein